MHAQRAPGGRQRTTHTMTRILIVDDEPTIRSSMAAMLRMENYQVSTASDGREALDGALLQRPDLIITDYNMPRMNGQQLLEALRAEPATAGVPVLMLSGNVTRTDAPTGGAVTANAALVKPFTRAQLLAALQALLAPTAPPA